MCFGASQGTLQFDNSRQKSRILLRDDGNIFVTIDRIQNISYSMRNVQKSQHTINTPQKKEILIYLDDLNFEQNYQVLFILGTSFKPLSMITSVPQKKEKRNFYVVTPCR